MPGNAFGTAFRFTTWGESHGLAIGGVVDGVPPRLPLTEDDIQPWLDKRRPGQSKYVTQRKEPDRVRILSGTFEGLTTGTPISLIIENVDQRPRDYSEIKDLFRPGHADFTYWKKYGIRDYRGSGRASARETAMRVAAGAVARQVLKAAWGDGFRVRGAMVKMGPLGIDRERWDWGTVGDNPFWCPDAAAVPEWESFLTAARKAGSSAGAVLEIHGEGVPPGLGEPVYDKMDADLAKAMMSINAVKAVEIGDGFAGVELPGEDAHDTMHMEDGAMTFDSNRAGGTLGGITNGEPLVVRFAVKPTSSLPRPRPTVTIDGEDTAAITKGRHDPCVGIRAVPIGEAMMACVLADHWLRDLGQRGR